MRSKYALSAAICAFSLPLAASFTHAQMQGPTSGAPVITLVSPVGGKAGTTFEVRVAGQNLADVEGLHFNFPGAKIEALGSASIGGGIDKKGKGLPNLTAQRFNVTLPANAPIGIQDVRLVTKAGISNPRAFVVSDHKESTEEEPNDDVPKAQRIEINCSVSGLISNLTDVDYYVFAGKKGQRVVLYCETTSIDSRLPAFVQVYSANDTYLGGNSGYNNDDALVDVTLPADGDYFARVCCFSYTQGGPDHFYRLTVSTAPWIDAVYPPVVEAGKASQVTIYGRNLSGGKLDPDSMINARQLEKAQVTIKASADERAVQRLSYGGFIQPLTSMLDGFGHREENKAGLSNPYLVTYASAPVVLDNGNNDDVTTAQKVPTPCVIAGKIEKQSDRDWYAFTAKKGQVYHIEAFAQRLGAPSDLLFIQMRDSAGTLLAEREGAVDVMSPQFYTRTDDPQAYRFSATADGVYHLVVSSRMNFTQFGPRNLYTVRITSEEPDFRLIAMPTSTVSPEANVVNQAGGAAFNVYVWRLGGFNEDITLSGEKLPPGLGVQPQVISAGLKQGNVVVHAEADAKSWAGAINLVGTATINGKKLVREVRAATITWPVQQANIPTITRLDRELVVAVRDRAPYTLTLPAQKISIQQGDRIVIPVKLTGAESFKGTVQVVAVGGPPGLGSTPISLTPGQEGKAALDIAKGGTQIVPGNYTVFLRGSTQPINPKQPPPKGTPPNIIQVSMPVTLTIIPKQLGKVTVTPLNAKVSPGKDIEVTARIARQFDLPLALKVEAILPPGVKGLSAKPATIKAGDDEVKFVITAASDAFVAPGAAVTVRFTAMFNDSIPIVHEAKLTLSLAK